MGAYYLAKGVLLCSVLTITKSNFEETVLKSDKPVLLDFLGLPGGPCRMQGPIIDQLAASIPTSYLER